MCQINTQFYVAHLSLQKVIIISYQKGFFFLFFIFSCYDDHDSLLITMTTTVVCNGIASFLLLTFLFWELFSSLTSSSSLMIRKIVAASSQICSNDTQGIQLGFKNDPIANAYSSNEWKMNLKIQCKISKQELAILSMMLLVDFILNRSRVSHFIYFNH